LKEEVKKEKVSESIAFEDQGFEQGREKPGCRNLQRRQGKRKREKGKIRL